MPSKKIKNSVKLAIVLFVLSNMSTAALAVMWSECGFRSILCLMGGGILLMSVVCLIMLFRPCIDANRLYRQQSPRRIYNEISAGDGYCRLCDMPDYLPKAFLHAEDYYFYEHNGIRLQNIFIALAHNIFSGQKKIGNSTIPQQLLKNLYLNPAPTMKRKLMELVMLRRLNKELSKDEILELYLNVIYYGNDKYGIKAASEYYYHVPPKNLTFFQCLSLASILPCPDKYNMFANKMYFFQSRERVIKSLISTGAMSFDELASLYAERKDL